MSAIQREPRRSRRRRSIPRLLALLVSLLVFGSAFSAAPAQAFGNAFFHTQSPGNRGADVSAIQRLLRQAGQTVEVTGVFDGATETAAKAFQTAKGLTADGIVGPDTWAALVPTLRQGASGEAVSALQLQLNAKLRKTLPVDGQFSAAVAEQVRAFQSHAGIGADGVVGATTWRNLIWHHDYTNLDAGICNQSPDGNTAADWGTAAAIGQLDAAARAFAGTGNGQVPEGDIGWEHGGDIPGHASHEVGLDVDLWPIRTDSAQCTAGRITWESATYDRAATRELVKAIRAAAPGHVKVIWFNDPTLIEEGLTEPLSNHSDHLHVRYCERAHPSSLYRC